jgi:hypothetical protein
VDVGRPRAPEPGSGNLIQHKELAFLAATTGPTNLVGLVFCRTPTELHEYLTHGLSALDSICMLETSPVQKTLKTSSPILHSSPRKGQRDSRGEEFTLLDDQHCAIVAEDPTFALDGDGDAQGDASHQPK